MDAVRGATVPAGYVLTWCGRLFGGLFGVDGLQTLPGLALLVLALSMAVCGLVRGAMTAARTRRLVHRLDARSVPIPADLALAAAGVGLASRIRLVDAPEPFSLCAGFRSPTVYLSTACLDLLTESETIAVLLHERAHALARDPARALVASTMAAAMFPLPVVAALRRTYLLARELEADHAATVAVGTMALAGAMWKLLGHPRPMVLTGGFAVSGMSVTRSRIDALVDPTRSVAPGPCRVPVATSVLVALAVALATVGTTVPTIVHQALMPAAVSMCEPRHDECTPISSPMSGCMAPTMDASSGSAAASSVVGTSSAQPIQKEVGAVSLAPTLFLLRLRRLARPYGAEDSTGCPPDCQAPQPPASAETLV
jgi:hypothetical protein